jgi:uncharacterized damage-inducible protein DinB
MDLIDRLLVHDDWATTQLLELSRDLTDTQLDQEFDIGLRTLRETFDHLIHNIAFWTTMMAGQPAAPNRAGQRYDRSMAALSERHERAYANFATLARRMRDEQRLDEPFVDHWGGRPTFGGVVIHVVLHNAEHRGEALHILQRLGVADLPELDHALWDQTARIA